jgi:hypothetical protein
MFKDNRACEFAEGLCYCYFLVLPDSSHVPEPLKTLPRWTRSRISRDTDTIRQSFLITPCSTGECFSRGWLGLQESIGSAVGSFYAKLTCESPDEIVARHNFLPFYPRYLLDS